MSFHLAPGGSALIIVAHQKDKMANPQVFVGSAKETRPIIDALEDELRDMADIQRWDLDWFRAGRFTLEELTRAVKQADFAIFVLGREDATISREGKPIP